MDDRYVVHWLARIAECRAITEKRHNTYKSGDLSWELRKLWEMERRLRQDKYMYGSYQSMLRDWTQPKPNTDPYYRKKINPMMLERCEPKGKNNSTLSLTELLTVGVAPMIKETLNVQTNIDRVEYIDRLVEELIHEADTTT